VIVEETQMKKRNSSLPVLVPAGPAVLKRPAYVETDVVGTETLGQYVMPPRLKIVQRQSGESLLEIANPGDVLLSPLNVAVVALNRDAKNAPVKPEDSGFHFTPVFFWPEYVTWNPLETRGQLPAVRERSLDPKSDIAKKARNPRMREEEIDGFVVRHCEHLNYLIVAEDLAASNDVPVLLTFARGEFVAGAKLAGLIQMRRAPIYACRFYTSIRLRVNNKGSWYGLECENPRDNPWVPEAKYAGFKAMHEAFVKLHGQMRLRADIDVEEQGAEDM